MISPQANNEAYHRHELEAAYLAFADDRCGSKNAKNSSTAAASVGRDEPGGDPHFTPLMTTAKARARRQSVCHDEVHQLPVAEPLGGRRLGRNLLTDCP
jgi:hypothetical protein